MIYYGLQATCILAKMRQKVVAALQGAVQQVIDRLSAPPRRRRYRDRMQATLGRDPLVCPRCGTTLWLWRLWHPRYGILYDAGERLKQRGGRAPMSDPRDLPLDETEWEMLGLGTEVTSNHRCSRCRHDDAMPNVVLEGFAASAGLKRGRMPPLVCPVWRPIPSDAVTAPPRCSALT